MFRKCSQRRRRALIEALEDRTLYSSTLDWTTAAPMPIPRSEGASFVADGKFFCFGGFDNASTLTISTELDAYDPATNTWTQMAPCPVRVNDNPVTVDPVTDTAWCGGFFLNDGFHASNLMYEYHVQTNTWSQGPSLPMNVGAGQMGVVGRVLYYFGGRNADNVGQTDMWSLNLDDPNAAWQAAPPIPHTANHDGAVVLNDKIYAIGGIVDKEEDTSNENYLQVFDPSSDSWSQAAAMPIGLGHIASAVTVADGDIIVCGGQTDGSDQVLNDEVLQYDPTTNSWSYLTNLPGDRSSDFVGYLDGKLIVTGGNMYSEPYISTTTWVADYSNTSSALPSVSIVDASAQAGSDAQFTATLSTVASTAVTASYTLTAGTAPASDFDASAGEITFTAGATTVTIDIPTYADSTASSEQFTLMLASLSGNAVFSNGGSTESATGIITPVPVSPLVSTTSLSASSLSATAGQSITFTATVTDSSGIPSGAVTFLDGGTTIGSADLDQSGAAAFSTTQLPVGSDSITAQFAGNDSVSASTSSPFDVTITNLVSVPVPKATATTLTASSSTLVVGQSDIFTATVAPAGTGPVPTGSLTLDDNGTQVGVYPIGPDGIATITVLAGSATALSSYIAIYSGDANYASSTSNAVTQTYLAASAVAPVLGKVTLLAGGITGQPFAARLPIALKNTGALQKGKFTLTAFADTAATGLSAHPVQLSQVTRTMTLKAGKSADATISVKTLPASLAAGTYRIVTLVTDPSGKSSIIDADQTVAVASPVISFSVFVGVFSPATLKPGGTASLLVSVTNTGNIPAHGVLTAQVMATASSGDSTDVTLGAQHWLATIKAGDTHKYYLRVKAPDVASGAAVLPQVLVSMGTVSAAATGKSPLKIG